MYRQDLIPANSELEALNRMHKRDTVSVLYDELNKFFISLLKKHYVFTYDVNLRIDRDDSYFSICFDSLHIGRLEYFYDQWFNKLVLKDYKHGSGFHFSIAEEAIKHFKEAYFPVLEAEDVIATRAIVVGKGEAND